MGVTDPEVTAGSEVMIAADVVVGLVVATGSEVMMAADVAVTDPEVTVAADVVMGLDATGSEVTVATDVAATDSEVAMVADVAAGLDDAMGFVVPTGKRTEESRADVGSYFSDDMISEAEGVTTTSDVKPVIADAVSVLSGTAFDDADGVTTASKVEPVIVDAVSVLSETAFDDADGVTTASEVEPVIADAVTVLSVTAPDEVDGVTTASEVEPVMTFDEATTVVPGTATTEVLSAVSLGFTKDFRDADEVTFGMVDEVKGVLVVFTGGSMVFVKVIVVKDGASRVDVGSSSLTF